jgi:repressor LexA
MSFARQLRKARQRTKLSQSELARRSGIHRTVINRYELGKSTPEIENLGLLADHLGVTTDELLGRV